MGLYDNNLNVVVNYTYDSWGNVVSITGSMAETLGKDNPFRYRGYYYDKETNLYYLNSRYYDSNTGRFINADGLVQTGQGLLDKNMFAYCANNPIIYRDSSGQSYVITIPAEGSGAATVPTGYSVTSSKNSSGTYTYTVSPSKTYDEFLNDLGNRESSNNYKAVNQYGYLGRYQIGNIALQDIGFKDSSGKWTSLANSYGVYSNRDFLNSPNAQEIAIRAIHKKTCGYIKNYGLDKYIGTTYNGVIVTQSGLLAACHLVGVGTMKDVLPTGAIAWDGNHVPAHDYMASFGGYDISEVW